MGWREKAARLRAAMAQRASSPQPPASPPPASEPSGDAELWSAGDIAECIHFGPWFTWGIVLNPEGPATGDCHKVIEVHLAEAGLPWVGRQMLRFSRWPTSYWAATEFRKVHPRADTAVAADGADFRHLLPAHPEPVEGHAA